jgi:hypothetical protein
MYWLFCIVLFSVLCTNFINCLHVCFNYCSGLESASSGTDHQAVGPQTQYQQCQKYDNFKLLIGTHGHSFLTV